MSELDLSNLTVAELEDLRKKIEVLVVTKLTKEVPAVTRALARVHECGGGDMAAAQKGIYFSAKDDCGQTTAYAKLMSESEIRDRYKGNPTVLECLAQVKSFKTLRVENHSSEDSVSINIWGFEEPGCDLSDLQCHDGTKIEIDGKEVYNDLVPGDPENVGEHDPECEDCHKA